MTPWLRRESIRCKAMSGASDIRVFAGTVADPFFIDLGAAFDSLNFRPSAGGGVLTSAQDTDNYLNLAPNSVAGFNVNTIVIEVPIWMLTSDGAVHAATDPKGTIGAWATTSRAEVTIRPNLRTLHNVGRLAQIQRLGNPLVNELVIGTGSKDYWSMSEPINDGSLPRSTSIRCLRESSMRYTESNYLLRRELICCRW